MVRRVKNNETKNINGVRIRLSEYHAVLKITKKMVMPNPLFNKSTNNKNLVSNKI
jgi:hypothetical protein